MDRKVNEYQDAILLLMYQDKLKLHLSVAGRLDFQHNWLYISIFVIKKLYTEIKIIIKNYGLEMWIKRSLKGVQPLNEQQQPMKM